MRKAKNRAIEWVDAPDISKRVKHLIKHLGVDYQTSRIICFRSTSAKTRAYARIWGLSRVWQLALKIKPAYVLEVVSEKFDRLDQDEKDKILLHEIAHIPMNFSGALIPHRRSGPGNFHDKLKRMITEYTKKR